MGRRSRFGVFLCDSERVRRKRCQVPCEERLRQIMADIHESCVVYGRGKDHVDYIKVANIAGFVIWPMRSELTASCSLGGLLRGPYFHRRCRIIIFVTQTTTIPDMFPAAVR